MTYGRIPPRLAEKIIRKHRHHKIFFGTDYPFAPITQCLTHAKEVSFLTQKEKEEILGLNALQFFHPK
jgi:predicted TIM-barrel fold metal-dependent hydrolase